MRRSTLLAVGALALVVPVAAVKRLRLTRYPRAPLGAEFSERAGAGGDPSVLVAAGGDLLVLGGLLLLGGLLVPRALLVGVLRPAVALLTGIGLQATLGLLLLRWPLSAVVLIVTAVGGGWLLRRKGVLTGWRRTDLLPLGAALTLVAVTAVLSRRNGWAVFTHDSWSYWRGGEQLAAGALGVADLELKRMLALQSLHAPGFGLGTDGVVSLGPVLLVVAVLWLALLPWVMSPRPSWPVRVTGVLAAVLVASSMWFWWVALYINSHLLVGTMLLLIVSLAYLTGQQVPAGGAAGGFRAAVVPVALAASAIALARPEGFVVVGLVLLGSLRATDGWRDWTPVWWVLGGVVVGWTVLLRVGAAQADASLLVPTLGIAAGLAILVAPTLLALVGERVRAALPIVVGMLLWSVTVALLLTPLGESVRFAEMVRLNLGDGLGQWYLAAPLIATIGAFGLALTSGRPGLAPARWLLIGFIPVTLLARLSDGIQQEDELVGLATSLLSGGGRTSAGDSVTRMWTHVDARRPRRDRDVRPRARGPRAGRLDPRTIAAWTPDGDRPRDSPSHAPARRGLVATRLPRTGRARHDHRHRLDGHRPRGS